MDNKDKDAQLWQEETQDITPLPGRRKVPSLSPVDDWVGLTKKMKEKRMERKAELPPAAFEPATPSIPTNTSFLDIVSYNNNLIAGFLPSLDQKTRKRLASGAVSYEAVEDLHGVTLEQAWQACSAFLWQSYQQNYRCVLIVHGKGRGYGPSEDMGIIKANIGRWLASHPVVMGFHTALPKHGGSGAIYILIKKNR